MNNPLDILKQYWGYSSFRPKQDEIISSVLEGNDTLALLPTGGGKSICFQVPALCLEGICIVVSPLIALMKDQVEQLKKRGIRAVALYAGMTPREIDVQLDNCIYGDVKFLYLSPERLQSSVVRARTEKMDIALLAIDEAHCISQWGYDFRPNYLKLVEFKNEINIERTIALTATATREVKKDIVEKLDLQSPRIFQLSFARTNLSYSVFREEDKWRKLVNILNNVPGSGIVYARTRNRTEKLAFELRREGIKADYYHGGLDTETRSSKQAEWISNQLRVMVATNAFGMGIDKPDVRSVIHYDLPDSLEAYYQEAGRAGRDEKKAYAVLLYHAADIKELEGFLERSSLDIGTIKKVYQGVANYYQLAVGSSPDRSFDFDLEHFTKTFDLTAFDVYQSFKILSQEGLIEWTEGMFKRSKVMIKVEHETLYQFQVSHASLDSCIKALLRLYGGEIHHEFIEIKEQDIARLLKVNRSQIIQWLTLLDQFEILDYVPATLKPQLTFSQPRFDVSALPIDEHKINWRRKVLKDKAQHVINYITADHLCRTRMFQQYFDEVTDHNCGVCDYCIAQKRERVKKIDLSEVREALSEQSMTIIDLAEKLAVDEQVLIKAIRPMLDEGHLRLEGDQVLKLN